MQREVDGVRTTLEWYSAVQGTFLQLRAAFRNPERFRFVVRSEDFVDDLLKKLGVFPDVEVGDPSFDARHVVKGFSGRAGA